MPRDREDPEKGWPARPNYANSLASPMPLASLAPFERLPSPRLVIATSARVFERTILVAAEREPNRYHRDRWIEVLARASWAHVDKDTASCVLRVRQSLI